MIENIEDSWLYRALVREFGAESLSGGSLSSYTVIESTIVYSPTYFKAPGFDKSIVFSRNYLDLLYCLDFERLWKARALIVEADKEYREYLESRKVKIQNHDADKDCQFEELWDVYSMEAYVTLSPDFDGMIEFKILDPGALPFSVTINPQDVMDAYQKLWEARYDA